MTIADVASLTGLSWDTVKEIDKSYLKDKYQSVSLAAVRYIAIDEVYLGRKRKFITIVMDLETRRVIHIGKGKGKRCLKRHLETVKTVSCEYSCRRNKHGKRVYVSGDGKIAWCGFSAGSFPFSQVVQRQALAASQAVVSRG